VKALDVLYGAASKIDRVRSLRMTPEYHGHPGDGGLESTGSGRVGNDQRRAVKSCVRGLDVVSVHRGPLLREGRMAALHKSG
jgi:hypothetical protein